MIGALTMLRRANLRQRNNRQLHRRTSSTTRWMTKRNKMRRKTTRRSNWQCPRMTLETGWMSRIKMTRKASHKWWERVSLPSALPKSLIISIQQTWRFPWVTSTQKTKLALKMMMGGTLIPIRQPTRSKKQLPKQAQMMTKLRAIRTSRQTKMTLQRTSIVKNMRKMSLRMRSRIGVWARQLNRSQVMVRNKM